MGKARREREMAQKKKKQRTMMIAAAVIVVILAIVAVAVAADAAKTSYKNLEIAPSEDGSLHIARESLGKGLNYIDFGGIEELILYKNGDNIAAAFDTCEECYPQGDVHFIRSGAEMQCSACGSINPVSGLGVQDWGGCQPIAIPDEARLDSDDEIVIEAKAFEYADHMFEHWDFGDLSVTFEQYDTHDYTEGDAEADENIGAQPNADVSLSE